MIKVIGHINPDTDATCAPIAYAWYLKNSKGFGVEAYRTGELNKETLFVLEKFNIEVPEILESLSEGDEYYLLDTNNPEELLPGFEKAKLQGIIDHHKLFGGLSTESPIDVVIETVGCTSTIVYNIIKDENLDIPKEIAGLMLSAIISDTLNMTSPTTTEKDKVAIKELSEIAEVDSDEYASEMFSAKSDLTGMTARDILLGDSKLFNLGDQQVRVTVLETTKPSNAIDMTESILTEMETIKSEDSLAMMFFFVVDIINSEAHAIASTNEEKEFLEKSYDKKFDGEYLTLPGVVSRKKQIIPILESAI